jgi:hypothetical protein
MIIYAFIVIANAKDLDAYIEDTNFNMWKGELPQPKPFGGIQTVEGVSLSHRPTRQMTDIQRQDSLSLSLSLPLFLPLTTSLLIPNYRTFGMVK